MNNRSFASFTKRIVGYYKDWKLVGAIDSDYDRSQANPTAALRIMIAHIADMMDIPPSVIDNLGPLRAPTLGNVNRGIPPSGHKVKLDSAFVQAVQDARKELESEGLYLSTLGLAWE